MKKFIIILTIISFVLLSFKIYCLIDAPKADILGVQDDVFISE